MGWRASWTNNVAANICVIPISPRKGEWLVAGFVNDAVADNAVWPSGWVNQTRVTNTTNSQDLFAATFGPCTGDETAVVFHDDSSVSNVIGFVSAYVQNSITLLDVAVVTAQTDVNKVSPWDQAIAVTPATDGSTIVTIMGHDIVPPGVDYTVAISASNTGTALTWGNSSNVDSPHSAADQGFEHIGTISAYQSTAANTTVTVVGTSTPSTSAGRAVILFALRRGTNLPQGGPLNQTVQAGQTATFSVTATTRSGSLSYQWQNNTGSGWNDIGGATSTSYTTAVTTSADDQTGYRVKVTDTEGTVTSDSAVLTVLAVGKPWHYTA